MKWIIHSEASTAIDIEYENIEFCDIVALRFSNPSSLLSDTFTKCVDYQHFSLEGTSEALERRRQWNLSEEFLPVDH